MDGLVVLAVGLVLCFFGVRSVHLAVLASGFALGWLLAQAFGATPLTAFVVAVAVALVGWLLVTFVFRAGLFFVGALAGAVVGAMLFRLLQPDQRSVVLAVLFVVAMGILTGLATQRFGETMLAAACALGGAALALSGSARAFPQALGFLHEPQSAGQTAIAGAAWIVLAAAGWSAQQRRVRVRG